MSTQSQLTQLLDLQQQPVAIAFQKEIPSELPHADEVALTGCTYWKHAAEGKSFYTDAKDHMGCPIGAYTHGIEEPQEHAGELEEMVGMMVGLEYIKMEEVPGIPRVKKAYQAVAYAPLDQAPFEADVVVVSGQANQIMVLAEAAQAAGITCDQTMIGRPTCATIPAVMDSGGFATNLGCIGNRVYTQRTDGELYFVFAARQLSKLVEKLIALVNANCEIEKFHRGRVAGGMA